MENKILFVTQDGYNITENDKYYTVNIRPFQKHPSFKNRTPIPLFKIVGPYKNPKATTPTGDLLYFYKKENAELYVSRHKPKLFMLFNKDLSDQVTKTANNILSYLTKI